MQITHLIAEKVSQAVKELYGVALDGVLVEHPQHPAWGDYSTNVAMVNAKLLGRKPRELAQEITSRLVEAFPSETVGKVEVAGPGFINFMLAKEFYLSTMLDVLSQGDEFGRADVGKGLRVALEHSNVNPNKAAHIGHLRNAVIGQFLERVYRFLGYEVNVQYYANDLGVQVSTSLLGVKKLGEKICETDYKKFDHYMWDIYARISQLLDTDVALKEELAGMIVALDTREPRISKEQKDLSDKVLDANLVSFSSLDVDYDLIVYESSIKDMSMWEIAFEKIKENSNVYKATEGKSAGCWLVRMKTEKGIEDVNTSNDIEEDKIIVRSNGVPTYTGKDIAYHMWKYGLLGVDFKYKERDRSLQNKILYETTVQGEQKDLFTNNKIVLDVIDVKQTYAIDAVRKSLEYLGYTDQAVNLIHINYGHVYLSNDTARHLGYDLANDSQIAMSGRKGIGVKIDDFIDMVDTKLKESHGVFPNATHVRNSAIKFDMLRYDTFQDIVFDIENSLNIKGFTGPYIQYTHARASSLLEKADLDTSLDHLNQVRASLLGIELNSSELTILQTLYRFNEIVEESAKKYAPNMLCVYVYELCQKYNTFYNDSHVLTASDSALKELRLLLTASTKQVIKTGLYLLGITAVDRM